MTSTARLDPADEAKGASRAGRFLALLLAGALAVALTSAALVAGSHWTPGGLLTHDTYDWATEGARSVLYAAAVLSLVGSQLMCFAMLVTGARGMPRRYFMYLPEFQSLHRVIAVGGALLILGAILALIRAKPATPS